MRQRHQTLIFTKNASGQYEFMDLASYNNSLSTNKAALQHKHVQDELKAIRNSLNSSKAGCSACRKRRRRY
jgi:hypothetical protein